MWIVEKNFFQILVIDGRFYTQIVSILIFKDSMEVEVREETEVKLLENNVNTKKDVSTDKIVIQVKFEGRSLVKNYSTEVSTRTEIHYKRKW